MTVVLCCKLTRLHWVCNQQQLICHRDCKRNLQPTSQALLILFTAQKAAAATAWHRSTRAAFFLYRTTRCLQGSVPRANGNSLELSPTETLSAPCNLCMQTWLPPPLTGGRMSGSWGAAGSSELQTSPNSLQIPQGGSQHAHCLLTLTWHFSFPCDGKSN